MRPIRSALLTATVAGAVYAGLSFCVLGAETWFWAQYCGDGIVQEVYEFCWDGTVQPGEACDIGSENGSVCVASYGGACTYCASDCTRAEVVWPSCGDGIVNENEACDDANKIDTDGCNNLCQVTFCGDNVVQDGESCDAWAGNGVVCNPGTGSCTYCSSSCETVSLVWARCGDGKVDTWEQCDDGNTNNNDACSSTCQVTFCGDGQIQSGESCDNGSNNGAVCSPLAGSSCTYCSSSCSEVTLQWARCGDGRVTAGETCDDGNLLDGDGCSQFCIIEPTILLDTGAWVPPVVVPTTITTEVTFGGEPVFLPAYLPTTGGPKETFRWVELNR